MREVINAKIQNGALEVKDSDLYKQTLERMDGKDVKLWIEKKERTRTLSQNAYYWGVVLKSLSEFTGYDTEDLHNHFKYHFLKKKVGNLDSFKSTTGLSKNEFSWYTDKIREFASNQLGFDIPTPEQMGQEEINQAHENLWTKKD